LRFCGAFLSILAGVTFVAYYVVAKMFKIISR